jgi:hypothetical protein
VRASTLTLTGRFPQDGAAAAARIERYHCSRAIEDRVHALAVDPLDERWTGAGFCIRRETFDLVQPDRSLTLWTGYMADTFGHLRSQLLLLLSRLWTLWATRSVVHKSTARPRLCQFASAQPAAFLDEAELDVGVADALLALLGLLERDRFADQRLADEDEIPGPLDAAVCAHSPHGRLGRMAR